MNSKHQDVKNDVTMPLDFGLNAQKDITAFELTELFPYIFGGKGIYKADLEDLEKRGLLRHLTIKHYNY